MNNVENGEIVYQDSIHPPDLIHFNVNNDETSLENSSSVPSPDSPLSTPPDSPQRVDCDDDGDITEEEKKEGYQDQDDAKAFLNQEEVPIDECIDNDNSTKNKIIPTILTAEFRNDDSKVENVNESTNGEAADKKKSPSLSSTNNASKPFDEGAKKTHKVGLVSDYESAPDDEKIVEDSFLPIVPKIVRSSDTVSSEEVMKTRPSTQTTTSQTEKRVDEDHREDEQSQSILEDGDNSDDNQDEPPSLTLIEKAKKRLSAHGLSDSPSSKIASPSKIENKKYEVNIADSNDVDVDEPPSLSRVEEAMQRTSMMVLKHNQRDRGGRSKITPTRPTNTIERTQTAAATTTANADSAPKNSESNRLAALQRDIMSLKSSLSDMNEQLHEDQIGVLKTAGSSKINGNENGFRAEEIHNIEENHTESVIDDYSDIPSAMVPITTSSTEFTRPKAAPDTEHCETSSLDGEIDGGKFPSSGVTKKADRAAITSDNAPLHRNTCHVVPYDDGEDEIMHSTKDRGPLLSKVTKSSLSKEEEGAPMDPNITMETTESSLSQDKSNNIRYDTIASFRKMTPKKDLQGSDNSAGWLQEELRRRAVVKRDINSAIESRGERDLENNDANGYNKPAVDEFPLISSPPELQNSNSTMDEEVAAITANDERNLSMPNRSVPRPSSHDGQEPPSLSKSDVLEKISRKLEYGDLEEHPQDEFDELMNRKKPSESGSEYKNFMPVFDYQDIQHEMKKFASETRAALRDQSFTDIVDGPSSSAVPVAVSSPLSVNRSLDVEGCDDHTDFQMNTIASSRANNDNTNNDNTNNFESISINFSALEAGEVPKMLISMDSFDGIASGDIFLSLLSENTGRAETSAAATWADRVHGAIWRARRMRKSMMQAPPETQLSQPLVRGGPQTVASVQQAALMHLKRNEIDDSINLVEGIVFAYYSYFDRSLNFREKNPTLDTSSGTTDFKPYIGMALHNLGVLNLLKGDYDEALSYFTRAVENRKGNLGENHPHYISSLVRLAVCRYALNEFAEAHAGLEEALACARRRQSTSLEGRLQVAEILNNLGCLAYMSGQPTTASSYYRDSMDIQFGALGDSLYLGNATSGQSISLNISVARANIGFIKLVTKDLSVAITALENALMEQQILLRGIDDTLIATMDHLALSSLLIGSQEKAALMYNRILTLQQNEYGPNDRRCFVTVEKMNMVQGKGVQYEGAIEELRKTFSVPPTPSTLISSEGGKKAQRSPRKEKHSQTNKKNVTKTKKKKVLKVLTSMIKKNP